MSEGRQQEAESFCGQCGRSVGGDGVNSDGGGSASDHGDSDHSGCAARSELEPPRYCARCARRMVVQIVPTGWTARCSRHGVVHSEPESAPSVEDVTSPAAEH